MTKPRVRLVPQRGLSITERYAKVGDNLIIWPLIDRTGPRIVEVARVKRNRYGRISYIGTDGTLILTESLSQFRHSGIGAKEILDEAEQYMVSAAESWRRSSNQVERQP